MQFVPEIADRAAHLTVFQRTPAWVMPAWTRARVGNQSLVNKIRLTGSYGTTLAELYRTGSEGGNFAI